MSWFRRKPATLPIDPSTIEGWEINWAYQGPLSLRLELKAGTDTRELQRALLDGAR